MVNKVIYIFAIFLVIPQRAYAYLDPGTGSMLLTTVVALVATLFFFVRGLYYKGIRGVLAFLGLKEKEKVSYEIIIYSEGKQYWNLFKPLVDEFENRKVTCQFLTSAEDDFIFSENYSYIVPKYIGIGNKAYTYLNFLETKICIMTTPGLDVLQIKRSRGVQHYAHIIHAPSDIHPYKLYSFDYYDSVFISGPHQEKSIRALEEVRGTKKKQLFPVGCLYYDVSLKEIEGINLDKNNNECTLLIAPSWGKNGLLNRYGIDLLHSILDTNIQVILRPHPQSFISEIDLMNRLEDELKFYANLQWDKASNSMESMVKADILLSDFSGIILDFAFLFERPVLTMDFIFDTLGFDGDDIPHGHWGLSVFDTIGKKINEGNIDKLPEIIKEVAGSNSYKKQIQDLKRNSIYNFGDAGSVAVKKVVELLLEL